MSSPFFSVIVPVYNRAGLLPRALDSVLAQTSKDWELLVVDDGSADAFEQAVSPYQTRDNVFVYRTENLGVSKARNFAAANARGEWLAFLDSDDEWLPEKLDKQAALARENKWPLIHGEEIWIRNGVRVNPKKKHKKGGGDQFLPSLKLCAISPSTAIMRKKEFMELGGFREDFPVCEDYDLWLKAVSLWEVGFVEEPIVKKYGGHSDQLSRKFKAMDYYRVKSLAWLLRHRSLGQERREALMDELRFKLGVLLRGYRKHGRLQELEETQRLAKDVFGEDFIARL